MKLKEMDREIAEELGILDEWKKENSKPRQGRFSMEQVRSNAVRVLNVIAPLTQAERKRVLAHALRLNEV